MIQKIHKHTKYQNWQCTDGDPLSNHIRFTEDTPDQEKKVRGENNQFWD